jgi:hypothetical protein
VQDRFWKVISLAGLDPDLEDDDRDGDREDRVCKRLEAVDRKLVLVRQPNIIPSAASDGSGSGSRSIRNALRKPSTAAMSGTSNATCSAR